MRIAAFLACLWFAFFAVMPPLQAQEDGAPAAEAPAEPARPAASADLSAMPEGEILDQPICFNIINKAPYSVFGSFNTSTYTTDDGIKARHHSNFHLNEKQQAEFCTYGPFYEGRKLELVLRTLVPVFSCKTAVTGDIVIQGRRKPEGGTDTWAVCL
jgi:hypothetical protein